MNISEMLIKHYFASFIHARKLVQVGVALVLFGAFLSIFDVVFNLFTLTGYSLAKGEVWRLVTNCLIERNLLLLLWSLFCLERAFSIFESSWGLFELIRFAGVVQILTAVLIAFFSFLHYILTHDDIVFFNANFNGLSSVCAGIFVAVKQFLPDTVLFTLPIGRLKNSHLPILACFLAIVLMLFGFLRSIVVFQVIVGTQISWTYLRFYQRTMESERRGDPSDHFRWYTLFPSMIQPCMKVLSSAIFSFLVSARICKPILRYIDVADFNQGNLLLPTLQSRDIERRRQKALRDLTQRINSAQAKNAETGTWLKLEDIEENVVVMDAANATLDHAAIQCIVDQRRDNTVEVTTNTGEKAMEVVN